MCKTAITRDLLASVKAKLTDLQTTMSSGDVALLRRTMCRFLQDKRIKVSLFLQEGIQSGDAKMFLRAPTLPDGADAPGSWKVLEPTSGAAVKAGSRSLSKRLSR